MANKSSGHIHDIDGSYLVTLDLDVSLVTVTAVGAPADYDISTYVPKDAYAVVLRVHVSADAGGARYAVVRMKNTTNYKTFYAYLANSASQSSAIFHVNGYSQTVQAYKSHANASVVFTVEGYFRKVVL